MIPGLLAPPAVISCLLSYASAAILRFVWDHRHDLSEGKKWQWRNFSEDSYFELNLFSFPDHRINWIWKLICKQLGSTTVCWQTLSWGKNQLEVVGRRGNFMNWLCSWNCTLSQKAVFWGITHYTASWLCLHKSPVARKPCPIPSLHAEARCSETCQYQ